MKYTLTIKYPDGATEARDFDGELVTVGRKNADIILGDDSVSSKHGQLRFTAGALTYTDVGSSNGSWLPGGRRIEQTLPLSTGDQILLGRCSLTVDEIEQPEDDRTAMLSAEQIREVLGQQTPAAQPAPRPAHGGHASQPQAPQPHRPQPAHQPQARAPQPASQPQPHQPQPAHQPQAHAPQPAHQPLQPKPRAPEPQPHHPPAAGGYPPEQDDWADEPADWGPTGGGGGGGAPPADAGYTESPRPPQGRGTQAPPPRGDESFGAIGKLLPEGIKEAIALFKDWKQRPAVGWPQIQQALMGAWELLAGHLTTAPIPLLAVGGFVAIFTILTMLLPSLAFLLSIASLIGSIANIVAYAATFLFLLRAYIGAPMTIEQAVRRTIADPKTLFISLICAGIVAGIGAIVVLVPGIVLGAFLFPAFWIEGRRMLGLNDRSLDLFRKDGKRILLTLLTFGVGFGVASAVVNIILGIIPFIGAYLAVIVGVALSAVLGAFSMALTLWLYFDIRAQHETGDPSAEAMQNTQ